MQLILNTGIALDGTRVDGTYGLGRTESLFPTHIIRSQLQAVDELSDCLTANSLIAEAAANLKVRTIEKDFLLICGKRCGNHIAVAHHIPRGIPLLFQILQSAETTFTGKKYIDLSPLFLGREDYEVVHQSIALDIF